jgi:hypothetical protein
MTMTKDHKITAYKGFNADWTCRGFQYEVGKTYAHEGDVGVCNAGFHACENPLEVFQHYAPTGKFAVVEMSGNISKSTDGDTKLASAWISVTVELSLHDFIGRAIAWLTVNAKSKEKHATGDQSAASATGDQSAASATGDRSAASATGDQSAASATGDRSAASATGDRSAASATGYRSAASATGYQSAASATGAQSAASATGDQSAASATGYRSAALGAGYGNKVMGKNGCALFLVERDNTYNIINARAGIVGRDLVEGVWYSLIGGEFVEVK